MQDDNSTWPSAALDHRAEDEYEKLGPFRLEAQFEAAQESGGAKKRQAVNRLASRYTKALDEMKAAETKLARALTKWNKVRLKLRRYERELDKLEAE